MKRLFWCAALLVLLAVVSYITTSCYASGSESLASATSTTAAPLSAVQKEQAAESPTQDARLVVGKYTLSNRDVANGKSGPTVLDALGLSNLLPGQLILIKGGSGMYRTSTEEAKRERALEKKIQLHTAQNEQWGKERLKVVDELRLEPIVQGQARRQAAVGMCSGSSRRTLPRLTQVVSQPVALHTYLLRHATAPCAGT